VSVEGSRETGYELRRSAYDQDLNHRPTVRDPFGYPHHIRNIEQLARMALYSCADGHGSPCIIAASGLRPVA
jgi:hypothetical protein